MGVAKLADAAIITAKTKGSLGRPAWALISRTIGSMSEVSVEDVVTAEPEHWTQDPKRGGGRIIGEVCHFVDLCRDIAGAPVTAVSASVMETQPNLMDTLAINLSFKKGSVATISYFSNGSKSLSKEYLEVFYCLTVQLDVIIP